MTKEEQVRSPTLPTDVIEEILSRLPIKSLMRFRCVSKQWKSLYNDPGFITKHMNRSTEKNQNPTHILVECPNGFYTTEIESCTEMDKIQLLFKECPWTIIHVEALCNGLVCLSFETFLFQELRLFNPVTRECQVLPNDHCFSDCYYSCFGLGFDPKNKEYKVVKITYMDDYVLGTHYSRTSIKIYTLGSRRWRGIRCSLPLKIYHPRNASVSGAVHWVATPTDRTVSYSEFFSLLSFDVQKEIFKVVELPDVGIRNADSNLSLGVLEGCLTVSASFIMDSIELWVMKEYGVKESWTKLFSMSSVGYCYSYIMPLGFWKDGEILLQKDKGKLILYNPKSKTEIELGFHSLPCFINCYSFVESLVCPRVGSGRTTKS